MRPSREIVSYVNMRPSREIVSYVFPYSAPPQRPALFQLQPVEPSKPSTALLEAEITEDIINFCPVRGVPIVREGRVRTVPGRHILSVEAGNEAMASGFYRVFGQDHPCTDLEILHPDDNVFLCDKDKTSFLTEASLNYHQYINFDLRKKRNERALIEHRNAERRRRQQKREQGNRSRSRSQKGIRSKHKSKEKRKEKRHSSKQKHLDIPDKKSRSRSTGSRRLRLNKKDQADKNSEITNSSHPPSRDNSPIRSPRNKGSSDTQPLYDPFGGASKAPPWGGSGGNGLPPTPHTPVENMRAVPPPGMPAIPRPPPMNMLPQGDKPASARPSSQNVNKDKRKNIADRVSSMMVSGDFNDDFL